MARSMWTLFEPIHAVTYFAAEARSAYEQAGLRGFWRGYFAGRAAPLGAAGPAVVAASFFNFAPAFVARAIPGVWELITPEEALRVRLAGAAEGLGRLLAGQEAKAAAAADLLWRAIGELDFSGRVLAAANAALPVPPGEDAADYSAASASTAVSRPARSTSASTGNSGSSAAARPAGAPAPGISTGRWRPTSRTRRRSATRSGPARWAWLPWAGPPWAGASTR